MERERERKTIEANQAASGTLMGVGSNAQVLIDQKTQEELDKFIVKHNADIQASRIQNAKAQNLWLGEMEMLKIGYEGQVSAGVAQANANLQAMGTLATTAISSMADTTTAVWAVPWKSWGISRYLPMLGTAWRS